jgi:hypothetical protein
MAVTAQRNALQSGFDNTYDHFVSLKLPGRARIRFFLLHVSDTDTDTDC